MNGCRHPEDLAEAETARLIAGLEGRVLEVGAGYGANFESLRDDVDWVGLEPNRRRIDELAYEADRKGYANTPITASCEAIPLQDASIDAVLGTLVLCSVGDQGRSIAEIARVLKPGGSYVFAEHVAAARGTGSRFMQTVATPFSVLFGGGCHPARDSESSIRDSPLEIIEIERYEFRSLGVSIPFIVGRATLR